MARCLLKTMALPSDFWGEAICTAVYVLNRCPTKSLNNMTPYEAWHGRKPNVKHMRIFGCVAYVKLVGPGLTKLSDRSAKMIFIGYESGTKGYRFFNPATGKLVVGRDAIFDENVSWDWANAAGNTDQLSGEFIVHYEDSDSNSTIGDPEPTEQSAEDAVSEDQGGAADYDQAAPGTPVTPQSSVAQGHVFVTPPSQDSAFSDQGPHRYRLMSELLDTTDEVQDYEYSGMCLLAADEPASVEAALEEGCWRDAMIAELKSIEQNKTWAYAVLPKDHKAIGLKWVFKVKKDPSGKIVKHKARLVVKGYAQVQGVDYDEVFAPVARMETVRLLLALAAQGEWQVHHMDVKSAFLNGNLEEEVYVHPPPGFSDPKHSGKVLRLKKALYGLKQAPRAWNARLDQELKFLGFNRSVEEHAVYRRGTGNSLILVGVYVDDLIICGPDSKNIVEFKQQMKKSFDMSDLGLLTYYLGLEVKQKPGEITVCQSAYAEKIVEISGMKGCNPADTPMEQHIKLLSGKPELVANATKYRSLVGSLRYLVNSRPDLAYSVGMISRFMETPNSEHWGAMKRIIRYVAGTTKLGCKYVKGALSDLVGFTDSDHAGDLEKRKSTSGVLFFYGGNAVSWSSQKQKVVSLSSCESEYIAAATGACQGVWLSRLVADITCSDVKKFKLFIDNRSAEELSKNPVFHERSKHIDTRYHYIRECVADGVLEVQHVSTEDQLADMLTKPLARIRFAEMRRQLGVVSI